MVDKVENGCCIWLTGLKGSGKTTLAGMLEASLKIRNLPVERLDGETIQAHLGENNNGTSENMDAVLLRTAFVAGLLARNNVVVIVPVTAFRQGVRNEIRSRVHHYVEVLLNAPLEIRRQRKPQGPDQTDETHFEPPTRPDIVLDTHQEKPEESLARILKYMEISGHIPPPPPQDLTAEESALLEARLRALGYL